MSTSSSKATGLRLERFQASAQYREGRFFNSYASLAGGPGAPFPSWKELFVPGAGRRPQRPLPAWNPLATWARDAETGLRVTWLGHSTLLLEMDGVRVLTDPVWAQRASPFIFAGPKRFQPVPVDLASLPPLDAVLLSHDHYDHLDRRSMIELAKRVPRIVTSLGVGQRLEGWGIPAERITELDWWEQATLPGGLSITATPAHHFSGRTLWDRNTTLWSSFVLRSERSSVFFSGDTGLNTAFAEIGRRFGPFDLVLLEVGAFHPAWSAMHLGPANAISAWSAMGSGSLLPIHWGTFDLATHAWYEPAEVLLAGVPAERLVMPCLGQAVEPARLGPASAWWREVVRTELAGGVGVSSV